MPELHVWQKNETRFEAMRIRPGKYDFSLLGAAVSAWFLCLLLIFGEPILSVLLNQLALMGWSLDARRAVLGSAIIAVFLITVVGSALHIVIFARRSFRERFRPGLLSHISFLALLWLTIGSVSIVSTREFPYIRKHTDQEAKQ